MIPIETAVVATAAAAGPHSIEALFTQHNDALVRFARTKVGDSELAGDLVQGVWRKAIERLHEGRSWDSPAGAQNWLYFVALNDVRDWSRRFDTKLVDRSVEVDDALAVSWSPERVTGGSWAQLVEHRTPERQLEAAEELRLAWALVEALPRDSRELLWLVDHERWSQTEAAWALGWPHRDWAKNRSYVARRAFEVLAANERDAQAGVGRGRRPGLRGIASQLWEKIGRRGRDDCWDWLANRTRTLMPTLRVGTAKVGKNTSATRVLWILTRGPLPPWRKMRLACGTPTCMNPAHVGLASSRPLVRPTGPVLRGLALRTARIEAGFSIPRLARAAGVHGLDVVRGEGPGCAVPTQIALSSALSRLAGRAETADGK